MTAEATRRPSAVASIVSYRLGGREYPMVAVGSCKVCQSPHRMEIESQILAGRTWGMIEKAVKAGDPDCDLSGRNIRDHYHNSHLPLEQEVGRRIIERRATQRGADIEKGVDTLIDGLTAAELVVQKGVEALQSGELKPDIKDMLTAARLLETFAPSEEGADQAAFVEAFMVYHETAAQVMSPQQFEAFGRALSRNPVLKALAARHGGAEADPDGEEDDGIPVVTEEEIVRGEVVLSDSQGSLVDSDPEDAG